MKIYLVSDNSGGWSLERCTIGKNRHLIAMPAMIARRYDKIVLRYYYDILGKGSDKNPKNSLLKIGELK